MPKDSIKPAEDLSKRRPKAKSVAIGSLKPAPRNARTHSDRQVRQIAESLREFGWMVPILVDGDNEIIAGHGRLEAAKLLGQRRVPVIVRDDLTEAQRRAYLLADNRLAEAADWDKKLLALEIGELELTGFDLALTGFSTQELQALMPAEGGAAGAGAVLEPDLPATTADVLTEPGDTWLLGSHRLACGDSTDAKVIGALLDGGLAPNLMVTDPPYGVDYDPAWRDGALGPSGGKGQATGEVTNDDVADWRSVWALFPGDIAYVWHDAKEGGITAAGLVANGFEIRAQIVWAKTRLVVSRAHYHPQHEPGFYAVRKGARPSWRGGRKQSTLWTIDHRKSDTGHATQKPVEAMLRPIQNHTKKGEAVFDPFMGSGTTLIAAEHSGRVCYGVEIAPPYVDLAVRRWQNFTGESAVRERDGQPFDETAAAAA